MVQYLLKLLEAGLEALDNPISTKAQIISLSCVSGLEGGNGAIFIETARSWT